MRKGQARRAGGRSASATLGALTFVILATMLLSARCALPSDPAQTPAPHPTATQIPASPTPRADPYHTARDPNGRNADEKQRHH